MVRTECRGKLNYDDSSGRSVRSLRVKAPKYLTCGTENYSTWNLAKFTTRLNTVIHSECGVNEGVKDLCF